MLFEFFRFEVGLQVRQPILWLSAAVFGLLAFAAISSDAVQFSGAIGNIHRNAPSVIIHLMGSFTILGLLAVTAFLPGALLREHEWGTAELFFSKPMHKGSYLAGRLLGGATATMTMYVVIALAMAIGTVMPWLDPARLGPGSIAPYLWVFLVIVVPNLIFTGALLSLLAVTLRALLGVYIGIIALITLWGVSSTLTADLDNQWLAALLDPFGLEAINQETRYWSAAELNNLLPPVNRYVLANRLLWLMVSALLAGLSYALFKPMRSGTGKGWRARKDTAPRIDGARPHLRLQPIQPHFDARARGQQWCTQWWFDTKNVLLSVPFVVMMVFGLLNLLVGTTFQGEMYGTKVYPVTHLMTDSLAASFNFILVLIATFFAGELVAKERQVKLAEVCDALPVPNWLPLTAKACALITTVLVFLGSGIVAAIGFQLYRGFYDIEWDLYASQLVLDALPFVLMGLLALVLQVYLQNKFLGYLAIIVVLIGRISLGAVDFEHPLYTFSAAPPAPYSDMNGYGHYLGGHLALRGYWLIFTSMLLVLACALWVRGVVPSWSSRWHTLRASMRSRLGAIFVGLAAMWLGLGAWIYRNTNVINEYITSDTGLDRRADYERRYAKYKYSSMPRITAVKVDLDLFPDERRALSRGQYTLINHEKDPMDRIHLTLADSAVALLEISLPDDALTAYDAQHGYRIYQLPTPLAPGQTMQLTFTTQYHRKGFATTDNQSAVVDNGSFINNMVLLPRLGYNAELEISDRNERRKRNLPERERMPKLEDTSARTNTYISSDSDWLDFETTVSTVADQVALAPGYLQREWTDNGRRYFHYKMDAPMLPFFSWLSARWGIRRDTWHDLPIEVYYDAKHPYNVDRMIEAVKASFDYYTQAFTPYQHRQVRILEFPGYASFAQAFANTIPYSESIGFIADLRDKDDIDYVFYVTAHEIAHQWWAHQVIGANTQGSTMLSESLAQYSALMVMEKTYGRHQMRQFLKHELDKYLSYRSSETIEELPLYRVENQQYLHYHKGSLVFYRLREEIGEDALNRALKRFLQDKGFQRPPYTTSAELLTYIREQAQPEHQQLITDLFEKISFYDSRMLEASAKKRDDGKYDVLLKFSADKRYADGIGNETPGQLDDWIEVGIFARPPGAEERDETVLYLQRRHITKTDETLTITVDEEPYEAGIDPYNKLIDRVSNDNRKRVTLE